LVKTDKVDVYKICLEFQTMIHNYPRVQYTEVDGEQWLGRLPQAF